MSRGWGVRWVGVREGTASAGTKFKNKKQNVV